MELENQDGNCGLPGSHWEQRVMTGSACVVWGVLANGKFVIFPNGKMPMSSAHGFIVAPCVLCHRLH